MGPTTLWQLTAWRAAETPGATMLIDAGGRTVGFGEFASASEDLAGRFAALGIDDTTHVSWQLPTRIDTLIASMALCRLGAAQNPIIPIYGERELRAILTEHETSVVVARDLDTRAGAALATAAADLPASPRMIDLDTLLADPSPTRGELPDHDRFDPDRVTWLYHTSGTTSAPKGVRHSDATLIAGGRAMADTFDIQASDVGSIAFPFAHIGGPDYLVTLLLCGIPAVLLESFEPHAAADVCRRHGVTMAGGTTAFYTSFLRAQRERPDTALLPSLRMFTGGGAPKPPAVFHDVLDEMGVRIVHGWAMTECPMTCCGRPSDTDEQLANTDGLPVLGAEVIVLRADGSPAGVDEVGELRVRGTMLFKGYADPTLNAAAFDADGWYRTGDLGRLRADGHVVVTGRTKDIIIRKGENVSAGEIEDLLHEHPDVAEAAVIGLPDAERGELVCAVICAAPGALPLTLAAVADHCRAGGLARFKTPERVEHLDALPRNATGKIRKDALRAHFGSAMERR